MKESFKQLESKLNNMIWGKYISASLYAVAKLAIADHLKKGSRGCRDLAADIGCHEQSLYRLMRALTTVGIFEQNGDKFSLTPLGRLLCSDVEGSQRARVIEMCRYFEEWGQLTQTVMTGVPPKEDIYDEILDSDENGGIFYDAMDSYYYDDPAPMLGIYDFSKVKTIVDIGGGSGSQLIAVLKKYPHIQGILFDRPDTAQRSFKNIEAAGLSQRCKAVGGDFFKSVPAGADLYMMRHVIHNWNDSKSVEILTNVREAMPRNGKVLVIEMLIDSDGSKYYDKWPNISIHERPFAPWWDMFMFVVDDGAERTIEEYNRLFEKAGLKPGSVIPVRMNIDVIEGVK